jgi:hypothetical protein
MAIDLGKIRWLMLEQATSSVFYTAACSISFLANGHFL